MIHHPHLFFWMAFFAGFTAALMLCALYLVLNQRRLVKRCVDEAERMMVSRRADFAVKLLQDGIAIRKALKSKENL